MFSFNPSRMSKRIRLQSPSQEQDAVGQPLPPTPSEPMWAEIKPMTGQELFRAKAYTDEAQIQVSIRYREGVSDTMTVLYKDRVFQILAVLNEEEMSVFQTLLCKEINGSPS